MALKYKVFSRRAWKRNNKWPDGYEPYPNATPVTVRLVETEKEAHDICHDHNKNRPLKGVGRYTWNFYEYTRI